MGHSQSYDLRNPEGGEKTPVRGVRRVSREHQTDAQFSTETAEPFDFREDELRDRIRREQLRKREVELETLRIRQHESREPIIDAYRQNQPAPQGNLYNEFNHYDSMKHASPSDPATYFALKPMTEVNEGRQFSIPTSSTRRYDQVPIDPSPELQRREVPSKQSPPNYPKRSSVFGGRVSPLPRQSEVDPHPMPRYIPPMSPSNPIDDVPPTHVSELHAEKRMIVGIDDELQPEKNNVTYVTVATAAIDNELLHRHPEVGRHPVYVLPAQTSYGASAKRRSSDDEAKNVLPPQNCTVEHCTHVAVNDGSPVVIRKRASQDSIRDKENRLTIPINEDDTENVGEGTNYQNVSKKCFEERLHYDSYMPTLSLRQRPVVSFYDKLH
ncbi:Ovule protein [Caenorhabditis elegans]|uniref:Ovule protein n=1 Tax=Caenorhabditis elegans TaxID=6239 RepID=Q17786_CAEEL|nr:Ovule protein [Caenorhabditis elegans]CAA90094.2 Ovule protein [Caenorhabditis elegans]|eukprot:NP_496230.2 Uncharacterized protein CELE_C07E3.3 [Caenorhabditis elegans]